MPPEPIPPELIDTVLNYVDDRRTLKACTVVCRSFCALAQKRLFSSFTLLPPSLPHVAPPPQDLATFLVNSPHIPFHVRRLHIVCPHYENWVGAILQCLALFTRLTSLLIDCRYLSKDTHSWESFYPDTVTALRSIAALPSMRTLLLYAVDLDVALQLFPPRVRRLVLYRPCFDVNIGLALDAQYSGREDSIPKLELDSLELQLDSLHEPAADLFFARFIDVARLRHLHVAYPESEYGECPPQVHAVHHTVDLQHLHITARTFDVQNDTRVLDISHLQKLHVVKLTVPVDADIVFDSVYSVVETVLRCIVIPGPVRHVIIDLALSEFSGHSELPLIRSLAHFAEQLAPLLHSWVDQHFMPTVSIWVHFQNGYVGNIGGPVRKAVLDEVGDLGIDVNVEAFGDARDALK
ncbi:hypothetical protein MIND_00568000 [Mycena indigotica]|uniref:F-box domain-containing protein n=1 Tax=Mycena indigotica TaxID=2126181 RepID=A0A8H6SR51_9AGAR|nr:uncharacterized protein MIND_00568000 [Mycena indigotica]KAF7303397.1 hypothetical protein MIND_00568000 [Mycena indigotica]